MKSPIPESRPSQVATTTCQTRRQRRQRRPLPPSEDRDWLTPGETALALGCSVATVHRLRRGLIAGIEPLPCSQYGRRVVFRKVSLSRWQDNIERREAA